MVKIFTMVKDEVDIIRDWIIYHASIFGYSNIYIIDNYSSDGTYEILKEYSDKIFLKRRHDYKNKGMYMTKLIDKYCEKDIAFPIDVDEFIILYENNIVIIDKDKINNYINNLPEHSIYKCNYIYTLILDNNINGYNRATIECKQGVYQNLGELSKSFINSKLFKGIIDHGNHIPSTNYCSTNICLVHYHCRNFDQMKKKVLNNIIGLGYKNNINSLKKQLSLNNNCPGNHHIINQIKILENTYTLSTYGLNDSYIDLTPLAERIELGHF